MMFLPLRLLFCGILLASCAVRASAPELQDLAAFPRGHLEIRSGATTHRFEVWIADTPDRQAQGLMFVRDLPRDRGMIFVHDPPRAVSMWMKNTYIELDMLFIVRDRIAGITQRARPHSLETIRFNEPVSAVVELPGGEAKARRLKIGDRVNLLR
jgi:uncharacterized protein